MKFKAGIDILSFKRFEKIFYRHKKQLIKKILSNYEIKRLPSKKNIVSYIGKCFSIKESILKALGIGFRKGIKLSDINLYKNHLGKPCFYISSNTKNFFYLQNIKNYDLTITDENEYIISVVIIIY